LPPISFGAVPVKVWSLPAPKGHCVENGTSHLTNNKNNAVACLKLVAVLFVNWPKKSWFYPQKSTEAFIETALMNEL